MSKYLVTLEDVGCRFSIRHGFFRHTEYSALKNISFHLHKGDRLGVIGKNGAGKSTLLRVLAGIYKPDSGNIYYSENVSVSLLSLQLGFSPNLTGRENVVLGAMLLGYTKQQALVRLDSIVNFSELGPWIDEPVRTYSSGMAARLGFSVAIELSPDILLIDEVLGVGDEAFRQKSAAALKQKFAFGHTIVFVSHGLASIRSLCSKVIWIEKGELRMVGKTADVMSAYETYA